MRALLIDAFGAPETLSIRLVEQPKAGPGDLLLRVRAAGVNPIDWKIAAGLLQARAPIALPHVPGRDCAGVIEAIGEGVSGFAVGQSVIAVADRRRWGTHAHYVALPAAQAAILPDGISPRLAAAIPIPGISALHCLTEAASLHAGSRVLIPGPLGGVGRVAMVLASQAGAEITALIRGDGDPEPARARGAAHVFRRIEQVPEASQDVVLDSLGGAMHVRLAGKLRPGGVLSCLMAEPVPQDVVLPANIRVEWPVSTASADRLSKLVELLSAGAFAGMLERAYPLAGAREAYRAMIAGGRKGRIVLVLS